MSEFFNLTPHTLHIFADESDSEPIMTIEPSGTVVRVEVTYHKNETYFPFPIYHTSYGNLTTVVDKNAKEINLNYSYEWEAINPVFIVSTMVLEAIKNANSRYEKSFFFAPGPLKRNDKGQVIGCVGLVSLVENIL